MSNQRILGVLAVMLGIVAVHASTAAAFTDFVAKSVPAIIKDKNKTNTIFKTNAGTVECTNASSGGKVTELKQPTTRETEEYTGCKAFGNPAKATVGEFEFHASGTVTILNQITVEVSEAECNVKFTSEGNKEQAGVTFTNVLVESTRKDVEIKLATKGVTYVSSGGSCGESGKNGEYKGSFLAEATTEGGTPINVEMV
jgi:hypothetical protein